MTLSSTTNRIDYIGNGAVASYDYPFRVDDEAYIRVIIQDTDGVETVLALGTDYTVPASGVGTDDGGSVDLVDNGQAWLTAGFLTSGYAITVRRVVPLTQTTDISNQGRFFPTVHERRFDHLTMIDQQQQDELDRTVKLPDTESGVTMTLPTATQRASKVLGFDADGDPIAVANVPTSGVSATAFAETLLDDETAAAARTTLGFNGSGKVVATGDLADLGVTTGKLDALAVTAAKLAADAVTTVKILDANVTAAKLAEAVYDVVDVYCGASSAGSDTYAVSPSPAFTSYVTGMKLSFKADVANTGAATLNVNGLGAKDIKAFVNGAVAAIQDNVIPASSMVTVQYDGTQFILLSSGVATGARLVSVSSLSAASSLAITGLTAGTRYRLDFSLIQNTADGNTRLGFNADTNARYAWTNRETISSTTGQNGATGDTYCYLSLSGSKTAEPILGHVEFCTVPGTASKATYRSTLSCIKAGTTVPAISESGGVYTGVADVTQVNLSPSAGTLTGTVLLYALGA